MKKIQIFLNRPLENQLAQLIHRLALIINSKSS
jgi:hypothetical protein